jgi:hypothetical protein
VVVTVGQIMLTASTNINVYAAAQIFFVVGLLGMAQTLYYFVLLLNVILNRPHIDASVSCWW